MREFRGPLPLSDDDFATVRATVLARIEARRRPRAWWLALAAAASIAAVGVLMRPLPSGGEASLRRQQARHGPAPIVVAAKPPATPQPRFVAPLTTPSLRGSEERLALREARGRARGRTHRRKATPNAPAEHLTVRLEIQTADPNVRVIWIVQ